MFFKDTNELKNFVDINGSLEFELFSPKLRDVDRDVLKLHFGLEFVEEIQTAYDGVSGVIASLPLAQQKAVTKFREISAPAAMALHLVTGQISVDSAGIYVSKNENRGIAWEWQIKDSIKAYLKPMYQAIEDTIVFLKANITDYTTFENSDEYEYSTLCFISTSKEFTRFFTPLNNSYMSFLKMRSCMDKVEESDIRNVLLPNYYDALKTKIKTNTLGVADKAIMPYIKKAIANLTAATALSELNATFDEHGFMIFDNTSGVKAGASKKTAEGGVIIKAQESLSESGRAALTQLKDYMESNISSYPVYSADPKYNSSQTATVTNTVGSGNYNAH
jgi:hypothetical protein